MSTGKAAEPSALKRYNPSANQLGEKVAGYDGHIGGQKIVNSEKHTTNEAGAPIIVRDVDIRGADEAIQVKTLTQVNKYGQPVETPWPELVAGNVRDALKKAYRVQIGDLVTRKRALTPLPGTNIYERAHIVAPKKITIIVQVPGPVTQEMWDAAARVLQKDDRVPVLPPVKVIIQSQH
jgi:hypothetical protein